jgi:flagellar hook-associated protein 1 FlgK
VQSTFSGIELAKRSLMAHQTAIQTVGHNLANASVDGYSRQRVLMKATDPLYDPALNRELTPGQIGQGVDVVSITRVHDAILESRIVGRSNLQGYWEARDSYMLMLEQVYNEPGDLGVRTLMDRFWEGWQELSLNPNESAHRRLVVERGQNLVEGIHRQYRGLKEVRDMLDEEVRVGIDRINAILRDVSNLNGEILKVEALGDNPNDLYDERDRLVRELAGYIDVTVENRDPDEYLLHTGGLHLIQGKIVSGLEAVPDPQNEGYSTVRWQRTGEEAFFRGGKIAGFLEMRDVDTRNEIQRLDTLTITFTDQVNEIHRNAFGKNGRTGVEFFREFPFVENVAGNYDRNGDGAFDSSYIYRINGTNRLNPEEQIGIAGTITLAGPTGEDVLVQYFPDDAVRDVIARINNSSAEVTAELDRNNRLTLKATPAADRTNPDFVIRGLEDDGQFLVGYSGILNAAGPAGAYTWEQTDAVLALRGGELDYAVAPLMHPAGWIDVNPEISRDIGNVAAGFGINGRPAEAGDGRAALAIASLRNNSVMVGSTRTFDEYFADVVADVGLRGETAERSFETENSIMKDLTDRREAYSGVNIDEELSEMIKFQQGYAAAGRYVNTINQMLDTIINRLGV